MDLSAVLASALRSAVGPEAAVYALAAIGLNLHYGYTGLLNFGQAGFMLVGAYGVAITVQTLGGPLWLGLVVSLLAAVSLAVLLGLPTLRLRGDYFAITTIAAAEILRVVVRSGPAQPLTGGVYGLQAFARDFYALNPIPPGRYGLGLFTFTHGRLWVMAVAWLLVAGCSLLVLRLVRSPWGRVLKAVRDDEDAARSLGKNVFAYKLQSLVTGGVIGALAGVMLAVGSQSAHPDTYLPIVTFFAYTVLILGGAATVAGPVVGAALFWFVISGSNALMRQAAGAGLLPEAVASPLALGAVRFALVGLALMLLMVYRPQGILGDREEMRLDL